MKTIARSIALSGTAFVLAATIVGCSAPADEKKDDPKPSSTSSESSPSASASEEPKKDTDSSGSALAPGERTTGSGIVPFVNYDDRVAEFEHRLVSVEKAPQADADAIIAEVPQAKGLDIYFLTVESKYVSGENLEHGAFYTEFDPVDADGNPTQFINLIGWDSCESNSIPSPGDDPNTTITNCYAALAAPGGSAPAGLAWGQSDTEYASYNGKPALFYLP